MWPKIVIQDVVPLGSGVSAQSAGFSGIGISENAVFAGCTLGERSGTVHKYVQVHNNTDPDFCSCYQNSTKLSFLKLKCNTNKNSKKTKQANSHI